MRVVDPGHEYQILIPVEGQAGYESAPIKFQKGPIKEVGVNGIQNIDLINILIDRMIHLQTMNEGKYACIDNEYMLAHLKGLKELDLARTAARLKRNVEGTSKS